MGFFVDRLLNIYQAFVALAPLKSSTLLSCAGTIRVAFLNAVIAAGLPMNYCPE